MSYTVPLDYGRDEFVEKKSRFIGSVWHIASEGEAKERIAQCAKELPGASHHCYAYMIKSDNIIRFSDAGEPQGTAGMPILEVFRRENVYDYVCLVTRYFGGVLLGAGGLTRAYAKGAKLALDTAGTAELQTMCFYSMRVEYGLYDRVKLLVEAVGGSIADSVYAADIALSVSVWEGESESFIKSVTELSNGRYVPLETERKLLPFKAIKINKFK